MEIHAPIDRQLGALEQSLCRAVASGSGVTVLALQVSPGNLDFQKILHVLRESHPLLSCKLHYDATAKTFAFRESSAAAPLAGITFHDGPATLELLLANKTPRISPLQKLLEHELNNNAWSDPNSFPRDGIDVVFGSAYDLSEAERVLVLRFHIATCNRASGGFLLRELMEVAAAAAEGGGDSRRLKNAGEGLKPLDSLIPVGLSKKRPSTHGLDMMNYTFNLLKMSNLEFKDTGFPRATEMVRFKINSQETSKILQLCTSRGIKLFGALSAAALLAAHSIKNHSDKVKKKYGVVTFIDCRSSLEVETPPPINHLGFYQVAILNFHTIKGTDTIWDLANTCYGDFARDKTNNKHFKDMASLNFLMNKAIENPRITPSCALRTSLLSVFEDTAYANSDEIHRKIGIHDYISCSSIHGVGPSIGIFDTIFDGKLDCTLTYPSPLHSRDQIEEIAERMREILIHGSQG